MMDLRYHVASLMSVFLALTVGIVVGISLGSSERQAATIQHLQQDVAAIRSEDSRVKEVSAELRRRFSAREEAEKLLLASVVRGRLSGRRVALFLVGDAAESLQAPVSDALTQAGADLLVFRLPRVESSSSTSTPGSANSTDSPPGQPAPRKGSAPRNMDPHPRGRGSLAYEVSPQDVDLAAAELTRAVLEGRPGLLEEARARLNDLGVSGELRAPIRRLLLLCPNDRPDYAGRVAAGSGVESAIARVVQSEGGTLVAAEPERTAETGDSSLNDLSSLLPPLAALGASTVDNINTAVGQIAAVFALVGAHGSYGTGTRASRPFPSLDEPAAGASLVPSSAAASTAP